MESKAVFANQAYTRIIGFPLNKIIGKKLIDLEPNSILLDIIKTGQPFFNEFYRINHLNLDIVGSGAPLFHEGIQVGVISIFRDVSNVLSLHFKLEDVLEQLQKTYSLATRYYIEMRELKAKLLDCSNIIFESQSLKKVVELGIKVANVDTTVLITGESGAGKEVIAKLIHETGITCKGPFVQINCAAIPESLLESELFGYEGGAFSGASKTGKPGLFEMAENGTILLDEISELPLSLQAKLLQVLQSKKALRVGGIRPVEINARVIAATNRDLEPMVEEKQFRSDLFYRLNVIPIKIPPLRQRKEDIIPLTLHFLNKFNRKHQVTKIFMPETLRLFQEYSWPGNVRELQNLIERVVITSSEENISPDNEIIKHLSKKYSKSDNLNSVIQINKIIPLQVAKNMLEEQLLRYAVKELGSLKLVAEKLEVDYSTIFRKMQKYNIPHPHEGQNP